MTPPLLLYDFPVLPPSFKGFPPRRSLAIPELGFRILGPSLPATPILIIKARLPSPSILKTIFFVNSFLFSFLFDLFYYAILIFCPFFFAMSRTHEIKPRRFIVSSLVAGKLLQTLTVLMCGNRISASQTHRHTDTTVGDDDTSAGISCHELVPY